jgi:hypothetical protein
MGGAQTINNQLKAVAATAIKMVTMTATMTTMKTKAKTAAATAWRQGGSGGGGSLASVVAAAASITIAALLPCTTAVATKTPAATVMAGAQTTIYNQLKGQRWQQLHGGGGSAAAEAAAERGEARWQLGIFSLCSRAHNRLFVMVLYSHTLLIGPLCALANWGSSSWKGPLAKSPYSSTVWGQFTICTELVISYIVSMYVTAPSIVHSMYPQHVGPLQLLSGEECSNGGLFCILHFACSANILHVPKDCPDSIAGIIECHYCIAKLFTKLTCLH